MESKKKVSTPLKSKDSEKETTSKKRKAEHPTAIEQSNIKRLKKDDEYYVKGTLLVLVAGGD